MGHRTRPFHNTDPLRLTPEDVEGEGFDLIDDKEPDQTRRRSIRTVGWDRGRLSSLKLTKVVRLPRSTEYGYTQQRPKIT